MFTYHRRRINGRLLIIDFSELSSSGKDIPVILLDILVSVRAMAALVNPWTAAHRLPFEKPSLLSLRAFNVSPPNRFLFDAELFVGEAFS